MSYDNPNYKGKKKRNQQSDVLQVIVVGIFKVLWWLIRLPFGGNKGGKKGIGLQEKNYITGKRLEIEQKLSSQNEIELKHLTMEADKLVDYTLQVKGYQGQTFADRLRSAQEDINPSVYDQIWQGHKVRNQIAHEQEFRISNQELRDAAQKLLNYLKYV